VTDQKPDVELWLPGYSQKNGRGVPTMGKARPRHALNRFSFDKVRALVMMGDPEALRRYIAACVRTHMPRDYQKEIKRLRDIAVWKKPREVPDVAVSIAMRFYFGRPHSRRVDKGDPYTGKPDLDNLEGTILDALQGLFWEEDQRVCALKSEKVYGDHPGTAILITYLKPAQAGLFNESRA